jgi:hypothetical protein
MDNTASSLPMDRAQAGTDSRSSSSLGGHDLLTSPDLYRAPVQVLPDSAGKLLPVVSIVDFKERALKLVEPHTDPETGLLPQADLAKMVADPTIKGADAVALATIYQMSLLISSGAAGAPGGGGSHRPGGWRGDPGTDGGSNGGSSRYPKYSPFDKSEIADLKTLTAEQSQTLHDLMSMEAEGGFVAADKNHRGFLTEAQMQADPVGARLLREVPALSQDLKQHRTGLTLDDFKNAGESEIRILGESAQVQNINQGYGDRLAAASTHSLFADASNPLASINTEGVVQGQSGDCYLLSSLAEVAKTHPEIIRDAIKDDGDGTYTVTFKGDPAHPVKIDAPTDTELALYASGSADGLWSPVMEKAYAWYATEVQKTPVSHGTRQEAISGGEENWPTELLTGHNTTQSPSAGSVDQFFRHHAHSQPEANSLHVTDTAEISLAMEQGRSVMVGTFEDQSSEKSNLLPSHAYSVVDYQPGADGGQITLRDPHGPKYPGDDLHVLTGNELKHLDVVFTFETNQPLSHEIQRPPGN